MAVDPATIWAQTQTSDPAYLAAHANNRAALIAALAGYGDPTSAFATGANGQSLASQYGIGQNDVSGAATNPYSTLALLKQQLAGDQTGIQNTANAHGLLSSGANVAATGHEVQTGQQRNYTAEQALRNQIAGITGNDTTALTGAFNNDYANALADQTVPVTPAAVAPDVAAPAAPAAAPIVAAPVLNNPIAIGGGVPYHTPGAPQIKAPPKPKLPSIGGLGHIT